VFLLSYTLYYFVLLCYTHFPLLKTLEIRTCSSIFWEFMVLSLYFQYVLSSFLRPQRYIGTKLQVISFFVPQTKCKMTQTFEAHTNREGVLELLSPHPLPAHRRAFVVVLDESPDASALETLVVSEQSLKKDWDNPAEDEAWQHLANLPSL
jgi:hypothetical protein